MKRFVFIIRGPVKGISSEEVLASATEQEQIREWLKGLKVTYQEMLFQKLGSPQEVHSINGKIDNLLLNQIDGGEISQMVTLILPTWEDAQKIARSFPFPSGYYSVELRELI